MFRNIRSFVKIGVLSFLTKILPSLQIVTRLRKSIQSVFHTVLNRQMPVPETDLSVPAFFSEALRHHRAVIIALAFQQVNLTPYLNQEVRNLLFYFLAPVCRLTFSQISL